MILSFKRLGCLWLALTGLAAAQTANPPTKIELPPNLASAGTTTTIGGAAWGYVVWIPNDPGWLATKEIEVFLKPAAANTAGTYVSQGTVGMVSDPAVLKILATRAASLGDNLAECASIAATLINEWSTVPSPTVPPALENRLSMLVKRASQSEFHAASLRQLGHAHPLYRMAMGMAWTGPLGVANGQDATLELRAKVKSTGENAGVVGRVTLRAGAFDTVSMVAPGTPVQVKAAFLSSLPTTPETMVTIPRNTDSADLGIHLRWAVPEALRRQALLTRGFHVWRVKKTYLSLNAADLSTAPVESELQPPSSKVNYNVSRLTRNPAVVTKLFKASGSSESGPAVDDFMNDSKTHFITDDYNRYATNPANPKLVVGTPFLEDSRHDYVVAPVDLLGRIGPMSARGEGIACRTVPPTVPDAVRVDNVVVGGNPRLRVVWKANPNVPANSGTVSTTHYMVFRDRQANTDAAMDAMQNIQDPDKHQFLVFIGTVAQPAVVAAGNVLTLDDPMLPNTADAGRTYFYTIRSVHQSACGYLPSSPSPPVFGTIRDHTGPAAPVGDSLVDCPRVGVQALGITGSTNTTIAGEQIALRLTGRREDMDVQWFEFRLANPGNTVKYNRVYFTTGENVWIDVIIPIVRNDVDGVSTLGVLEARAGLGSGRFSHWERYLILPTTSSTQRHTVTFTARSRPTRQMVPDDNTTADYWEKFLPGPPTTASISAGLDNTLVATIPANFSINREVIVQSQRFGVWGTTAVTSAVVSAGATTFTFRDTFPGGPAQAYRVWTIVDPNGSPTAAYCKHDAKPAGSTTVVPIQVSMTIPTGAPEYRIYRRVNDGALTLLKQDAGTYDATIANSVMLEDTAMPTFGGSITYYGQVFDSHGNPSALAVLGEKHPTVPELPKPVLDTLEAKGTATAPLMRVRAACPSPGVGRLKIIVTPGVESAAGLTVTAPDLASDMLFQAGKTIPYPGTIHSPLNQAAVDQPFTVDVSFAVKTGVEYSVQVQTIGTDEEIGPFSDPQQFTWVAPIVAGEVPWPARALPKVITWNSGLAAFETIPAMFVMSSTRWMPRTASLYPVGIRLGSIDLTNPEPGDSSNWSTFQAQPYTSDIQHANFGWNDGSTTATTNPDTVEQKFYRRYIANGDVGYEVEAPPLLPVALYRQQLGWGTVATYIPIPNADVVQVSPLITRVESILQSAFNRKFRSITDPFVNVVMIHSSPPTLNPVRAELCLFDTTPVVLNAVYAYYLVHFDSRGEIDHIINAGKVAITQP